MLGNWLDGLGDLNPQLFRELKGRWNWRNLTIASAAAILPQLLVLLYHGGRLPNINLLEKANRYCTGQPIDYSHHPACLMDSAGNLLINWQLWWLDVFSALTQIGVLAFLVLGVHLIISDLEKEDRLGTLNFLRLTPQSTNTILAGKLFGVPILLFWGALLWLPLHVSAGLSAQIPALHLLSFYGVAIVTTLFYYDAALLYSLTTRLLGGFQPWLGSGTLFFSLLFVSLRRPDATPLDWIALLSPINLLPYLVPNSLIKTQDILDSSADYWLERLTDLSWYNLPIGANGMSFAIAMVIGLVIGLWWTGRVLERVFRNPTNTLLSKRQSYLLVICVEVALLGFCDINAFIPVNNEFGELMILHLIFFLGLIAALTPHRQTLQDWARYRHTFATNAQPTARPKPLIQDLLWSEKSPALLTIAVNAIVAILLILAVAVWRSSTAHLDIKDISLLFEISLGVMLSFGIILIYALVSQLLLMLKTNKRGLWTAVTIASLVVLPPIVLAVLSLNPDTHPELWLFTAFPWAAVEESLKLALGMAIVGQTFVVTLGTVHLTRQLRRAGESAFKQLTTKQLAIESIAL